MPNEFQARHIGPCPSDTEAMLQTIGVNSLEQLMEETIPSNIKIKHELNIGEPMSEYQYLQFIKEKANKNVVCKNYIGLGYYNTITPTVIQRNIFENPGWYTQYTPYQAEISQGRLEALLNFQTMISDLTGFPIANASLLDEGTAVAEAMHVFYEVRNKSKNKPQAHKIFIDQHTFPQTIDVVKGRALPLNIEVIVGNYKNFSPSEDYFAVVLQYPNAIGSIEDYKTFIENCKAQEIYSVLACDILSLALLTSPEELGADVAVGNSQRFGVPMGFGGPHAAFFACKEEFVRLIPGRLIGVSVDKHGNRALRMALQTREQHIKREKATSNICTAQALLAIMASMYAVYHGKNGIKNIALNVHNNAVALANELKRLSFANKNAYFFDTIIVDAKGKSTILKNIAEKNKFNFWYNADDTIQITIDETTTQQDVEKIASIFAESIGANYTSSYLENPALQIPQEIQRQSDFLTHEVFNTHHSETEMLRYIKRLESKDLSLCVSMIPLGSCTMKLNATSELIPLSWPEFAHIHPFQPKEQVQGYLEIIQELEEQLSNITGFAATSLQPNSGAQGEYAGLMLIRAFHVANGNAHRNVALIPTSAHGTNPASAAMAGMQIVLVKTTPEGNIDVEDLKVKAAQHAANLSCLMVTYPSTHGVFEESIIEICDTIHQYGGKVYMDGANMNAQVGLTSPATIGADVNHINLHKTFAIPHGGGGPGMGPICCTAELAPFLPSNPLVKTGGQQAIPAISAAPFGSAAILLISYAYNKMLGTEGVVNATKYAILNANYLRAKLAAHFPILYSGANNRVAHEFIMDIRPFKKETGVDAADIAKRLMDYGYHAPTVAFPVPGTLMIEPTESESKKELDTFCDALISIKQELDDIIAGKTTTLDNPIINAPHTAKEALQEDWTHVYTREKAVFPLAYIRDNKFWPSVAKIDNTYGDRNLVCTCLPIEHYAK
ncbi:MAG TPA: aminomethyl-transferring glycine dehydrogenase [Chitinophagales bacterium]|jgi:glycine dehydrogenase|nr:aminomethyl-transferring glycine dehydrogenase [Chitinophagales bacterium]MBP6153671.1 aminomethyl-transferring glycine dehydrogenase [Chitinophagales bacterium]HQV79080.1 aminomethyl-transferring glycine dehydrogenase [Chitinophagales bacterium]HQW79796.1 aminomethyl-transferring glycine dehydrogenase [Chitinophagales bacterium]HRB19481.1 aminomethyl-transferring glycine dehydrogenase [Chitinophagales bacterium]